MKDSLGDKTRLEHIMECIMEIEAALTNENYDSFYRNHVLRIAIVKWLEIIGEAANHITSATKEKFAGVHWGMMIGLRNIVVHEYFGINYQVIWDTATDFVEKLKSEVEGIITSIK